MTDLPLIGSVEAPDLHVMSFNIRRRMPHLNRRSPDRWEHRKPLIRRLLASEAPTLLGVQEALPDQENFVLNSLGDAYRSIGYGRLPGRDGERCPLFYDSRRLQLLGWRQLALSDTPDVPGSTSWGNRVPRVVVSAEFRDSATGAEFLAVNTHLDHRSPASRLRSAAMIGDLVAASGLPAIVSGDFNTDAGSLPYDALTSPGSLRDSWNAGAERLTESWGTFPNYGEPEHGMKRIDWILTSPTIQVLEAAIDVKRFGGDWPSDHAPVHAVLRLG